MKEGKGDIREIWLRCDNVLHVRCKYENKRYTKRRPKFSVICKPAFTTNAMTSDFLSWISHGWVVTFQDSHLTVFTFRSWLDLLGVVLAVFISILKISKLLKNCWHRVIDITSSEKHLESSLDHTLNFCRNLVIFRSKIICQKESLTRSSTVI